MSLHYDEKGKFFTDYITKDTIRAVIQTATHRIEGTLYVRAGERVLDMLNRSDKYIALTDTEIFDLAGEKIASCEFLALNVDLVIWLKPEEPMPRDDNQGDVE
jgi:hypothetical protein